MKRPNIIFILIDDMGWKDLVCYGSSFYETPHIDRLAREDALYRRLRCLPRMFTDASLAFSRADIQLRLASPTG